MPTERNRLAHEVIAAVDQNPRDAPSRNGSAAVPPWPTTPLRIPNRPAIRAERDGRHGVSEA